MADQDVKQLLLQVDASIELLRSNLGKADTAVKGSTDKWAKDADKADASFGKVGKGLNGIGPRLREINNLTKQYGATSAAAAAKAQAMQRQLQSQSDQIANGFRRAGGVIGTYFGVRELTQINDKYIEFTNGLRVAGVEAGQTKVVQDALYASAQKYGIELNSLGTLYSRASQASQTLGASQSDLLRFSDGVSAALKVQGGSTESASGALLQLSQALQAGTVRAEEFNSINEGAFPILQAVAAGSTRFAGSVAKLRAEVLAGTVSSKEFFQSFLAGAPMLEDRAVKATLTTAAGFVTLQNALQVYVGEANNASGVSAALGAALSGIADNIDVVIPAIAAIGVALGIGFVASAAKASGSARGVGGAILGAFGGPVGLAVTGLALAVGAFGAEVVRVDSLVAQANLQYETMQEKLKTAAIAAGDAASGNAAVGKDALGAIPKVNSFAGAVGELAQKLYDQARAARLARVEMLKNQLSESQAKERELGEATAPGRAASQQGAASALSDGNVAGALRITRDNIVGGLRSLFTGGQSDRDTAEGYRKQVGASQAIQAELAKALNPSTITASDLPGGGVPVAGAGNKKGPKGPSAETIAKREEAERQRDVRDTAAYAAELRRGRLEELALQADATNDQALRADIERRRVELERDQLTKEIAADGPAKAGGTGRYSTAQVAELQVINQNIATAKLAAIDTSERCRVAADQLALSQADRDNQEDVLRGNLDLVSTTAERRDLELRILDLQIAEERARLEAVTLASGANATEVKIAQARLAILDGLRGQEAERIERNAEGPLAQRRRQVRETTADMNVAIENIELDALDRFTDGLANASTEFVKLGGIAGDVVNSIIRDLVRLTAQQAIFGSGGGTGGLFKGIGSLLGFSRGGYTGNIPEDRVAGVVHGGEYVFDAAAVKRIGRDELEAMRSGTFTQPSVAAGNMGASTSPRGGVARVELMLSDDIDGRIQSVSGDVAVSIYQAGARGVVEVAKAETIRELTRPRM